MPADRLNPAEGGQRITRLSPEQREPLLRTKLFVPSLRVRRVARPDLIEQINDNLDKALLLVSAPAGFGKTTLLAEWAAQARLPVAWLSLDAGDNDPHRFLRYLIAALKATLVEQGAEICAASHWQVPLQPCTPLSQSSEVTPIEPFI